MPTSYTSLLGLALPVTGELSGTWGDTVNNYITQYVDAAVAGVQTISGSQTAVTLSVTNGSSLITAGSGATGSAQFQIINCTGNPAGLLTITAPASSRQYIIINGTSTAQSVKIVGTGPTTGVTLVSGEKAHVAWNGSDFVKIATQSGTGEFVTVDTTNLEVTNIKAKDGTAAATIADSTGAITVSTLLNVDNLRLDGNTLSSTDSNGNVVIAPNGTGDVQLDADTVRVGDSAAAVTLTSNGAGALTVTTGGAADLILNTNSGSTSGSITIGNGTNGNITVATNGTGDFYVDADTVRIGDSNANATITTNGTGDLILNTNAGTNSGSITIEDGVNGNIIIAPNGTGQVQITNAALDLTTIEVTNIKAKDGTASMTLADTTGIITLSATAGTANGVLYLNGSRAVTSGSALTFDGSNLGIGISPLYRVHASNDADAFRIVGMFENPNTGASAQAAARVKAGTNTATIGVNGSGVSGATVYIGSDQATPILYYTGNSYHYWQTATTEKMRLEQSGTLILRQSSNAANTSVSFNTTVQNALTLDSSGNLGLGVTPSAWGSSWQSAQVGLFGGYSYSAGGVWFTANAYNDNTNWRYANSNWASAYQQQGGAHAWYTAPSGTAGNAITFTQAMTLNASGQLSLGTTNVLGSALLSLAGKTQADAAVAGDVIANFNNSSATGSGLRVGGGASGAGYALSINNAAGTELMQVNGSGNLGLGVTPSAWVTTTTSRGMQFGRGGSIFYSTDVAQSSFGGNYYQDGATSYKYLTDGYALRYSQSDFNGSHSWHISPSGSLGGTISFTQAMTLHASGGLSVGNTTDPGVGNIGLTNGGKLQYSATAYISPEDNIAGARIVTPGVLNVATGGTAVRMTLDASGYLVVGDTNTNARFKAALTGASTASITTVSDFGAAGIVSLGGISGNSQGVYLGTGDARTGINGGIAAGIGFLREASGWNSALAFYTNGTTDGVTTNRITERARIDSSGNLGLGVTPSAWSIGRVLQFGNGASIVSYADNAYFNANAYFDSGWKYLGNAAAGRYEIVAGAHAWYRSTSAQVAGTDPVFSQAMTLDASGRLGIGETNPDGMVIVKNTLGSGVLARFIQNNASFNSDIYINHTSSANNFIVSRRSNGEAWLYQSGAEPIAFYTNATERARITSGGDVGIGTSNPGSTAGFTTLTLNNASSGGIIDFQSNTSLVGRIYNNATNFHVYNQTANALVFGTNGTERARITSGGDFLITTNTFPSGSVGGFGFNASQYAYFSRSGGETLNLDRFTSEGAVAKIRYAGTEVGSISVTASATAYNTSSDYRLKDNPQPLTGSGAFIDALKPKTWDWKSGGKGVGFIAHEVQAVSPGSVVGEKDAVDADGKPIMQAMEYGSAEFIANIIAELQSLRARVAQLEAK